MDRSLMDFEAKRVRSWIVQHKGILSKIAVQCDVSPQFVQQIAYGTSTALAGHPAEIALRKHGWPGIRRKHA